MCITVNSFPLHFFILQSLLLTIPPKYLRSSPPFQNVQHWFSWFQVMIFLLQIKWSNVAIQFLCSTDQTSDCHLQYNSSKFLFTIRCHQISQHHHHKNKAFMCQSDPVFLCARFNSWVTQRNSKPARRDHFEMFLTRTTQITHWGRGHLNCLNARSRGSNNFNQLLYCVSLKIYNKFANYFCELKFSGNTHQRP